MSATTTRSAEAASVDQLASRLYAGYFLAQAIVGILLWLAWGFLPTARKAFELSPDTSTMDSFLFADMVIGVGGSLLAALGLARERSWALPVMAFTAGGLVYATLYLVGWVSFAQTGSLCLAIMVPPAALSTWLTYQQWKRRRPTTPRRSA